MIEKADNGPTDLEQQKAQLMAYERELNERTEELEAQKEELTAAIEELVKMNNYLNATLAELQERNQELDQLVYRASHDFKTPITSTLGIVHLLKMEPMSPMLKEYVHRIDLSMHQMNDLLKSLSLFTQASLEEVFFEHVHLATLVENAKDRLQYQDGFNLVRFDIQIDKTLTIKTDAILVSEALKALIINAIIFRGSVEPFVCVKASMINNNIDIIVEDNGEGMTDEVMQKAFNIFYRGSEKSKGTGLGLYMVKKIVQRLGGNVRLKQLTKGLSVTISLPTDRP
ncbi:MAG: sensor histidine kinase [Cytophagia bacterium]|nr:sensor histidine kinase [Cytophagia bacterium]